MPPAGEEAGADRANRSASSSGGSTRGRSTPSTGRSPSSRVPPCRKCEIRSSRSETRSTASSCYRLEQEAVEPAKEADRVTLIRRLSFDLTGLPPTPEEVRAFVEDKSPDAYEKVVERLLAQPALRRADGGVVARPRALRRLDRLPQRQPDERVAVPRLRHPGVQRQQAVRPVHGRATRRRPAARTRRGSSGSRRRTTGCSRRRRRAGRRRRSTRRSTRPTACGTSGRCGSAGR